MEHPANPSKLEPPGPSIKDPPKRPQLNYWALLFPTYWLPYYGLWKPFFIYIVPVMVLSSLCVALGYGRLSIMLWGGLGGYMAYYGGAFLERERERGNTPVTNVWSGIGGVIGAVALSIFMSGFWEGFIPSFQESYHAASARAADRRTPASVRNAVSQEAGVKTYTSPSRALMDGKNAVGGILDIPVMFSGIQVQNDEPFMTVLTSGTLWWVHIPQGDLRDRVDDLEMAVEFDLRCRITRIDSAYNVCEALEF